MKVTLIDSTKNAREILILSKSTRLNMTSDLVSNIMNMEEEEKEKQIEYVFGSTGSSWEFVDYIFLIEGVTRGFTHQFVRSRVGTSFAQQSLRVVDQSEFDYLAESSCKDDPIYHEVMNTIKTKHKKLIDSGKNIQDARGILPTNILSNILFKANLRAMSVMASTRLCVRTQGEYQDVVKMMVKEIVKVHPWAEKVLDVGCVQTGYCPWKNFDKCPVKTKFKLYHTDERRKEIKEFYEKLGTYSPQPEVKR